MRHFKFVVSALFLSVVIQPHSVLADVVRADAKNVEIAKQEKTFLVESRDGSRIRRVAQYIARGNFFLVERGEARGIDTRRCEWKIDLWIERRVGLIDPDTGEYHFRDNSFNSVYKDNLNKGGGPIDITKGHRATCNDRLEEWKQDGDTARQQIRDAIPDVMENDKEKLSEEFQRKGAQIVRQ